MPPRIGRFIVLAFIAAALLPSARAEQKHAILYVQAMRYDASVTPDQAAALLKSARDTFGRMPQVRSVRIGKVARTNGPGYEYALIMEFDRLDDLKAYSENRRYTRMVKEHADARLEQDLMLAVDVTAFDK